MFRQFKALRASTPTRVDGFLTPEPQRGLTASSLQKGFLVLNAIGGGHAKSNTEAHLSALSHCNGVFTVLYFLVVVLFGGGTERGIGSALSTSMIMQVAVGMWSTSTH